MTNFDDKGSQANDITIMILTYNEEINIERCLTEAVKISRNVVIVDSYSNDETLNICKKFDCRIYQHKFTNQAMQINWAIENIKINTNWVLRLDADEYLTNKLLNEVLYRINHLDNGITGVYLRRRIYFMGKWIKYGGVYPTLILRLWRNGKAVCEQRWMDEHMIILEGLAIKFDYDFIDDNKKDMSFWISKHNNYATREAFEQLNEKCNTFKLITFKSAFGGGQAKMKKYIKQRIYNRIPLPFRSLSFFIYIYIIRLGFLDGYRGFVYHFMSAFWYRLLVDIKTSEMDKDAKLQGISSKEIIKCNSEIKKV